MSLPSLLLTELDAVNQMLASIGQTPVNTLDVSGIRDVAIAKLSLQNTTREVLNRGWSFNTDHEWELNFTSSEIVVPSAVLWLDPVRRDLDFVIRDDGGTLKLWDKLHRTFDIEENYEAPIKVDIIHAFLFETIPNVARQYIAMRASRIFQTNVIASEIIFKFTAGHEAEAYADLLKMEAKTKDRNWFRSGADSNEIVNRRRNAWR